MQRVNLDMKNYLMGDAIKTALRNNGDFQVEIAEQVKEDKRKGLIDLFLFGATSASFLTALLDTL